MMLAAYLGRYVAGGETHQSHPTCSQVKVPRKH